MPVLFLNYRLSRLYNFLVMKNITSHTSDVDFRNEKVSGIFFHYEKKYVNICQVPVYVVNDKLHVVTKCIYSYIFI